MKANVLLKRNIDALLKRRGHSQKDLAQYCYRTEEWLSKALRDEKRGIPLKYLDRIAAFFGIEPYQLVQPGINALTERRSGLERRSGTERRIGRGGLMKPPPVANQAALIELVSYLDEQQTADFVKSLGEQVRGRLPRPSPDSASAGPASARKTRAASGHAGPATKTARGGKKAEVSRGGASSV